MSTKVIVSLYRKIFKVVTSIKQINAENLAIERYAEFIPKDITVNKYDNIYDILYKIFTSTPYSIDSLSKGFLFLKDINKSMFDLELLSLWNSYSYGGEFEILHGIAIISATLHIVNTSKPIKIGELTSYVLEIKESIKYLISEMKSTLETHLNSFGKRGKKVSPPFLNTSVTTLLGYGFSISEGTAEDYTFFNLIQCKKSSLLILNTLLTFLLFNMEIPCTLVGIDSYQSWVRIQKEGGRPLFLSFSHPGGHTVKDIVYLNSYSKSSSQWWRATKWDGNSRKHILSTLLKKQLLVLSSVPETSIRLEQQRLCRVQILFLLS